MRESLASKGKQRDNGRRIIQIGIPNLDTVGRMDALNEAAYLAAKSRKAQVMADAVAELVLEAEKDQEGLDIRCVKK